MDLLFAQDRGEPFDPADFDRVMRAAVADTVNKQIEAGVDVVSDGEMSKISYATYIRHRLTGFEGDSARPTPQDLDDVPEFRDKLVREGSSAKYLRPVCKGPIKVKTDAPLKADIARMKAAAIDKASEAFMNAVSPGTIAVFQPNEYYPTHEAYQMALAEVMREEYETIVNSGLLLQVDCPDLAMGRHSRFKNQTEEEFLRTAETQVEALNHALANVPADRVRMHVCWGNYEGPHTHDIPLEKLLPVLFKAKPQALVLEGANPRHEHEWEVWTRHRMPADKILIAGVLDSSCNFVEHPELIAQRLERYAKGLGRERVLAGSDCGFGTFAGFGPVHPSICWLKLKAMAEGAAIASKRLWS